MQVKSVPVTSRIKRRVPMTRRIATRTEESVSMVYPPARRRPRAALRFFSCSSEAGFLEAIAYHVTSVVHPGMRLEKR